jgi:hypothetical protein
MSRCLVVLEDATVLRIVEECHAVPWVWRIRRFSVVLEDVTLLRGVEGCNAHGASWLPSTPKSSVASSNNTEQNDILQQ